MSGSRERPPGQQFAVHLVEVALRVDGGGDPPVLVERLRSRGAARRVPVDPDPVQAEGMDTPHEELLSGR
ncbi:hypothetical protein BGK67_31030 [Streptomyces subrutilus]|uniref:Uncharacterized protein n=1 Tax=Streptomyces subrutilus TaxID=36818 RepID=A0A1E5Q067_9ACTN|nr:hypothetical protein BGK67_31030 [Streptomyces subrutilus]